MDLMIELLAQNQYPKVLANLIGPLLTSKAQFNM